MAQGSTVQKPTLNELLLELVRSDNGSLYIWEQCAIYPVSNQVQILKRGIEDAIESENYMCAASLMRSLIESIMVLVYALSIEKTDESEFYEQFIDKGRLQRWSKSKNKYENVRDEHLITQFEKVTKIKIRETYDNLCNLLHFSVTHMQMLATKVLDDCTVEMMVGEKGPTAPKEAYATITTNVNILMTLLKGLVAQEIHKKRLINNEPRSTIAQEFFDIKRLEGVSA